MAKPHIERPALPWRETKRTLCGRDLSSFKEQVLTIDEARTVMRATATADVICSVCWGREWRCQHREWGKRAVLAMEWECMSPNWPAGLDSRRSARLEAELQAIADLIAAHREEFDGLVDQYEAWRVMQIFAGVRRG